MPSLSWSQPHICGLPRCDKIHALYATKFACYGFRTMKANIVRVVTAALIGLATTAVVDSQAGDRFAVVNATVSRNAPVVDVVGTFRQLDRNGDGSLSLAEFEKVDRIIGRLQTTESGLPYWSGYVTALGPFWSNGDLNNLF